MVSSFFTLNHYINLRISFPVSRQWVSKPLLAWLTCRQIVATLRSYIYGAKGDHDPLDAGHIQAKVEKAVKFVRSLRAYYVVEDPAEILSVRAHVCTKSSRKATTAIIKQAEEIPEEEMPKKKTPK